MTVKPGWGGRFYEDIDPGDIYRHPLGRTSTEADNTWFTLLTMNTNQIHFNSHAAHQGEFGKQHRQQRLYDRVGDGPERPSIQATTRFRQSQNRRAAPDEASVRGGTPSTPRAKSSGNENRSRAHTRESFTLPPGVSIRTRTLCCRIAGSFFLYKRDSVRGRADHFPVPAEPFEISE